MWHQSCEDREFESGTIFACDGLIGQFEGQRLAQRIQPLCSLDQSERSRLTIGLPALGSRQSLGCVHCGFIQSGRAFAGRLGPGLGSAVCLILLKLFRLPGSRPCLFAGSRAEIIGIVLTDVHR